MEDTLLTRQEVAEILKVSLRSADTFIHQKDFEGLLYVGRSVRISKKYLMDYISKHLQYQI